MFSKVLQYLRKMGVLILLGIFLLVYYISSRSVTQSRALLYPNIIMVIYVIVFAWNVISLIIEERRNIRKNKKMESFSISEFWEKNKRAIVVFLSTVIFVFISRIIGFWVVAFIYILTMTYYLGLRKLKLLFPLSIILTIVLYLLFTVLLKTDLPKGFLM